MPDHSERKRLLDPSSKSKMERSSKEEAKEKSNIKSLAELSKLRSDVSEMPTKESGSQNGLRVSAVKMPKKATEDEFAKGPLGFFYTLAWIGLVWIMGFGFLAGITYIHYLRLGDTPVYFGEGSFIGSHPHLIIEPNPAKWQPADHGVIAFHPTKLEKDKETHNLLYYYGQLQERYKSQHILSDPKVTKIPHVSCANFSGNNDGSPRMRSCLIDWQSDEYGPCSLTEENLKQNAMGLAERSPCVMIRLSNLIGWFPDVPEVPSSSKRTCSKTEKRCCHRRRITFDCVEGESRDNSKMIQYEQYPKDGMDTCAFPYWNQPGYQPPFAMLKFNLTKEMTTITCSTNLRGVEGKAAEVKFRFKMKK